VTGLFNVASRGILDNRRVSPSSNAEGVQHRAWNCHQPEAVNSPAAVWPLTVARLGRGGGLGTALVRGQPRDYSTSVGDPVELTGTLISFVFNSHGNSASGNSTVTVAVPATAAGGILNFEL
jgi:hypothetical protein